MYHRPKYYTFIHNIIITRVPMVNILALIYGVPSMFINKLTNAMFWQTRDGGTNACVGKKRKNKNQGNQIK